MCTKRKRLGLSLEVLENRDLLSSVAVFDNRAFVVNRPADHVQASLVALGHSVSTFTSVTPSDVEEAIAGKDALLIPALLDIRDGFDLSGNPLIRSLHGQLGEEGRGVIENYVSDGGTLIVTSGGGGSSPRLLNSVFGFDITRGPRSFNGVSNKVEAASRTSFAGGTNQIPNYANTDLWFTFGPTVEQAYQWELGSTAVAEIPSYGNGRISYLGWDWSHAAPSGDRDGGWLDLLDRAVTGGPPTIEAFERAVPSQEAVNGDEVTFRVRFSEDVQGFTANNLQLVPHGSGGIIQAPVPVEGTRTFDVRVTNLATTIGELGLDLISPSSITGAGVRDVYSLENQSPEIDETYRLDPAPQLTQVRRSIPNLPITNANQVTFEVWFTREVTNVDAADFQLTGTGTAVANGRISDVTPSPPRRHFITVDGLTGANGTLGLELSPTHDIQTEFGTLAENGPPWANESYVIENERPIPSFELPFEYTTNDPIPVGIQFSEDVIGFGAEDIFVQNGMVVELSGGPREFTAMVQPALPHWVYFRIPEGVVEDSQGNLNTPTVLTGPIRSQLSFDYGDAPDSGPGTGVRNYETLESNSGPQHAIDPEVFLGLQPPDADTNGFSDGTDDAGNALDDDQEGSTPDDEDGWSSPRYAPLSLIPSVEVSATNNSSEAATLVGWIDYDRDGSFEASEAATAIVPPGTSGESFTLAFPRVPDVWAGETFARLRISTDSLDAFTPGGFADDGEVEDYLVEIYSLWFLDPGPGNQPVRRQAPGESPIHVDGGLAVRIGFAQDDTVVVQNEAGEVYERRGSANGIGSAWVLLESVVAGDGATWFLGPDSPNGTDQFIYRWADGEQPQYANGFGTSLAIVAGGKVGTINSAGAAFVREGSEVGLGTIWQSITPSLNVTVTNDVVDPFDGETSLREAVITANSSAGADAITFDNSLATQTITLSSGQLELTEAGAANLTTISGPAGGINVSGNDASRIFSVNGGVFAMIDGLTLIDGIADQGGAIFNAGDLTVLNSVFRENVADPAGTSIGGAISSLGPLKLENTLFHLNEGALGGAINSSGELTVTTSSFSGNKSTFNGGALRVFGDTSITASTFSNNEASNGGGGLINHGDLKVNNSTFAFNTAAEGGGLQVFEGSADLRNVTVAFNSATTTGGGIRANVSVTTHNTVVAGSANGDVAGSLSGSHNLVQDGSGGLNAADGNIFGDPILGTFANHGGSTFTVALLQGSPALNAGEDNLAVDANNNPLVTDQRGAGFARILGGTVDIGAYEYTDTVAPTVESFELNGNGQRSIIREIAIQFSETVNVTADSFEVRNTSTNQTFVPIVTTEIQNGKTIARLTFSGTGIDGGSVPDGDYVVSALASITDAFGNSLEQTNATTSFSRLFGDRSGDGVVNIIDFLSFVEEYKQSVDDLFFDFNGDGVVNIVDLLQFRSRYSR